MTLLLVVVFCILYVAVLVKGYETNLGQAIKNVEACSPGFIHEATSGSCGCAFNTDDSYVGIDICNLTAMRAYRRQGYWIGYELNKTENEDTLASGICPRGFCLAENLLPEKADREELDKIICSESRTGFFCGECKQNMSVYFHSQDFKYKTDDLCSLGPLFYVLSEIIPVTVILLVIIYFKIPITSGLVNGFIFYC